MSSKALLSAILDQLEDVIARQRREIPPQEYRIKNPDGKRYEEVDEPGYPFAHHPSLIEVTDDDPKFRCRVVALRWWPAIDPLCELRTRTQLYRDQL
jgi:hypothetical protein